MKIDKRKIEDLKYKLRFHNAEHGYLIGQGQYENADRVGKIVQMYESELKPLEEQLDNIYSFWFDNFFKYYKITFKNCSEFPNEMYLYPYKYTKNNDLLSCVINYNTDYKSGLEDSFISMSYFYDYDYECEEITKEEFIKAGYDGVEKPLFARLDKLKNRDKLID